LRERGAGLVVRRGDWAVEVARAVAHADAQAVHLSADVSGWARRRVERLRATVRAEVVEHPGTTVVPPGALAPAGGGEFKVFTPYHRRWLAAPWRAVLAPPARVPVPDDVASDLRALDGLDGGGGSPGRARGGERTAVDQLRRWARTGLARYGERHDDLAAAATSRVSAALHFGCLSPLEVATRLRARDGADPFVRQLCWRDFAHQLLAARPDLTSTDYRSRGHRWNDDGDGYAAWCEGRTGYPVVDAGMRQLRAEGFLHNRARLVVASFLTKDLYVDWRLGAAHFMRWLTDGDVANNTVNWQWVAGTGTDTNPHRIFNPTVQGRRFDPDGVYVRRHVEELRTVDGDVHDPDPATRGRVGYPQPIVDHREAIAEYRMRASAT
jgi:deoxyribodipyrimidine photo-lyase